jgi:hypothetical protein
MSYKALINSNVNKLFNLVKDLADVAVLTKKTNVEFNFKTGNTTADTSTLVTKIIITDVEENSSNIKTIKKQCLLKTKEIGDISLYSTITSANKIWKIGPIIRTDRFVTIVELYE